MAEQYHEKKRGYMSVTNCGPYTKTPTWDAHLIALQDSVQAIDYACLYRVSDLIGNRLTSLGMHHNEVVAVIGGRGIATIMCLYALANNGAAFLTLPTPPPKEWFATLGLCGKVRFALADLSCGIENWENAWTIIGDMKDIDPVFTSSWVLLRVQAPSFDPPQQATEHLAYVLTTSGSTGLPKSVEVSVNAFTAKLDDLLQVWPSPPGMKWLNWHHYSFDVSLWEVFGCLRSGGSLYVPDDGTAVSMDLLAEIVEEQQLECMMLTPTVWRTLKKSLSNTGWAPKRLILAGEAVTTEEIRTWAASLAPGDLEIWNAYGPTETTIYATAGRIWPPSESWQGANIGRLLPHTTARIRPLVGERSGIQSGELLLGGSSVASGYGAWLFPVTDADRARFAEDADGQWYATGDIVQSCSDGSFVFIGRQDRQVKVEGVRIELDAIEAVARRLVWVRAAYSSVVNNSQGRKGLALAIIIDLAQSEDDAVLRRQVRRILGENLPRQHMPVEIAIIRTLEMMSSGKLDRRPILEAWREKGWIIA